MAKVADGLAERNIATLRYQFLYMERGSKRPDPPKLAHAAVRAAVAEAARRLPELPLIAGGKSFGGRMTSQAQAAEPLPGVRGLAFLGFPLHPAKQPSRERGKHLFDVQVPMLFLQGTRDALAALDQLKPLCEGSAREPPCGCSRRRPFLPRSGRSGRTDAAGDERDAGCLRRMGRRRDRAADRSGWLTGVAPGFAPGRRGNKSRTFNRILSSPSTRTLFPGIIFSLLTPVCMEFAMAPRPYWKGYLKLSLVACPVSVFTATTTSDRVSFRQINKKTGNRLRQQLVDEATREVVETADKGRGYEVDKGVYIQVEEEELEALEIESNHTIDIDSFVPHSQIDERYFDTTYYIAPNDQVGREAFGVIREAMRGKDMVALGRIVVAKRERVIALQPWDKGLLGTTLRYAYEVRNAGEYFDEIPDDQGARRR